ncbi:MAG: hypothetical protein JWQ44_2975 [Chthoniobacter sp.]|nr:hypothetical protein [Chthoniobacter sp.]
MKRKLFISAGVAVLILGMLVLLNRDPTVEWSSFTPRLSETFQRTGFTTLALSSCSPDQVAVPFTVRWHPRRWRSEHTLFVTGFPNAAEHYTVAGKGSSQIECFVRYLDGRASAIDIRSHLRDAPVADILSAALRTQFPRLSIHLQTNDG